MSEEILIENFLQDIKRKNRIEKNAYLDTFVLVYQ